MKKYFQAPWTIKDMIKSTGVSIFLLILSVIALQCFEFEGLKGSPLQLFLGFIVQWIIILGPAAFIIFKKYKLSWKNLGFTKISALETAKHVLSAYILYLGITFILSSIVVYSGIEIPGYQIQESLAPIFDSSVITIGLGVLIVVIAAPIIEEVFFRGLILRPLINKFGLRWGSVLTALIFSVLHFPWQSFIPIFILGMIINSIVIRSKSLWPAIAFHMINNGIAFTLQILINFA